MILIIDFFIYIAIGASVALSDKLPAGSSYLPPTAASASYGAADDYDYSDSQASYGDEQVREIY